MSARALQRTYHVLKEANTKVFQRWKISEIV